MSQEITTYLHNNERVAIEAQRITGISPEMGSLIGFAFFSGGAIATGGSFFILLYLEEYPSFFFMFFLLFFFGVFIMLMSIWAENAEKREDRAKYYFTNKRILKHILKGGLTRFSKIDEMDYDNLSYIINDENTIYFISKGPDGSYFYDGNEEDYLPIPKGYKVLKLPLFSEKGRDTKNKIMNLIQNTVPSIQHPKQDYLHLLNR